MNYKWFFPIENGYFVIGMLCEHAGMIMCTKSLILKTSFIYRIHLILIIEVAPTKEATSNSEPTNCDLKS